MSQNNEALIRRWMDEVWNERRTDAIYELLAPEGISYLETAEIIGPAQFHQYHSELLTAFPDLRVTVDEVISQGDAAAVRWTASATHEGPGYGLEPTRKAVSVRGMTWVHIRNGKIVEGWDAWNLGRLMQQLKSQ